MKPLQKLFFVFLVSVFIPVSALTQESFKIDIHGYISQGYLISNRNNFLANTENGTFHFNELGINFSTELTEKIRLGIQFAARDKHINPLFGCCRRSKLCLNVVAFELEGPFALLWGFLYPPFRTALRA